MKFRNIFLVAVFAFVSVFGLTTIASASGAFISSALNDRVLEFEPDDGEFFRIFASNPPLEGPEGLLFAGNENLYVSSCANDSVLLYDGGFGGLISIIISYWLRWTYLSDCSSFYWEFRHSSSKLRHRPDFTLQQKHR